MAGHNLFDINWIIAVIRRWKWLIIGLPLLAMGIAFVAFSMMPPIYSATATLMVDPRKTTGTTQYNDLVAAERIAYTYSQMVKDHSVMDEAISKLDTKMSPSAMAASVEIVPIMETQLLQLTATNSSAEQAAKIANSVAEAFSAHVEELSNQRFAESLQNAQAKVDSYKEVSDNNQQEMNSLRVKKINNDSKVAQLNTSMSEVQTEFRYLQQRYQDLQLTVAQATGTVHVVEPAQVTSTPPYTAVKTSTIVMSIGQNLPIAGSSSNNDQWILSYGQLLFSPTLLEGVIKDLGLEETPAALARRIRMDLVPGTQLLRMKVDDSNGDKAKLISEALSVAFLDKVKGLITEPYTDRLSSTEKNLEDLTSQIARIQEDINRLNSETSQVQAELERLTAAQADYRANYQTAQRDLDQLRLTIAQSADSITITQLAQVPARPTNNRNLYVFLAAAVGLVVGLGLAFFLGYMDIRIRTRQDLTQKINLPILGSIGKFAKNEMVLTAQPDSSAADSFRGLGAKIRFLSAEHKIRTILVTSPAPTEGKSVVVANLSITLARMGLRVIAVDADLWLPRLHQLFGIAQSKGLSGLLLNGAFNGTLTDEIQPTDVDQLRIVTSGDPQSNPSESLTSPHLENLLSELAQKADLILIDCPPVLSAADASILASKVDGVLLVMRSGQTDLNAAQDAINALEQVNANIMGVVLNAVPNQHETYNRYYYGKFAGKKAAKL